MRKEEIGRKMEKKHLFMKKTIFIMLSVMLVCSLALISFSCGESEETTKTTQPTTTQPTTTQPPPEAKTIKHSQAQPYHTKPQAILVSTRRPIHETAVKQCHQNAMCRRFVQSRRLHDLGQASLRVLVIERRQDLHSSFYGAHIVLLRVSPTHEILPVSIHQPNRTVLRSQFSAVD